MNFQDFKDRYEPCIKAVLDNDCKKVAALPCHYVQPKMPIFMHSPYPSLQHRHGDHSTYNKTATPRRDPITDITKQQENASERLHHIGLQVLCSSLARDITFTVARRVERSLATVQRHAAGYQEYGFKSKGHIYRSLPYGDDILS